MRRRAGMRVLVVALAALAAVACAERSDLAEGDQGAESTTTTAPADGGVGAAGAGDPYFPEAGNGGYDVARYVLDLAWAPDSGGPGRIEGTTRVEATATQALTRFHLDLVGLDVAEVTVDGEPAEVSREGERELVITPATPIADGAELTAEVTYGGVPQPLPPRAGVLEPGWMDDDGEVHVLAEPDGAATFFPVNDHPSDKAAYELRITAPDGLEVAANGELAERVPAEGGGTTWVYDAPEPMASYLVQVVIGDLELVSGEGPGGLPLRHAFDTDVADQAREATARTGEMVEVLADLFGPYPFATYGTAVVDDELGLALETQTLSIFGPDTVLDESVQVHELAHQWFGNHVSPATWRDIWLNEGFAVYASWLWEERTGGPAADEIAAAVAAQGGLDRPPGDPGAAHLFDESVYFRGGVTLHVLREEMGDDAFFRLLRTWLERYGGEAASTDGFEALAADVAGRDLSDLFDAWLRADTMPDLDDWV